MMFVEYAIFIRCFIYFFLLTIRAQEVRVYYLYFIDANSKTHEG